MRATVLLCIAVPAVTVLAVAASALQGSEQIWNKPYPVLELPIHARRAPIDEVAWSRDGTAIAWWPAARDEKDLRKKREFEKKLNLPAEQLRAARAAKEDGRMFRFSNLTMRRNPPADEFLLANTFQLRPDQDAELIVAKAEWPRPQGTGSVLQVHALKDQSLRIWHSYRGEILRLMATDQDWLAITPEGYYHGSPGAEQRLLRWKVRRGLDGQPEAYEPSRNDLDQMRRPELLQRIVETFQQEFLSEDKYVLPWITADLQRRQPRDRKYARYFVATHLHNESLFDSVSRDDLWYLGRMVPRIQSALSFLLNSLSWKAELRLPERVDPAGTILHIDLRHYGWNDGVWKGILAAEYPYGLKRDGAAARTIETETGSELAFLRADWFVFAASKAPLYHDLLDLPRTTAKLERLLGVDVPKNLKTVPEGVVRAGFSDSGVSFSNRLIERHPLDPEGKGLKFRLGADEKIVTYPEGGYYWKSYDFETNKGRQNLFAFPLGPGERQDHFEHSAGEVIFSLPNGLQGYLLIDRDGTRIDSAPIEIVRDVPTFPRKPTVTTAFSCIICHLEGPRATMVKNPIADGDQVLSHFEANVRRYSYSPEDSENVRALYRSKNDFDRLFDNDVNRFKHASNSVTNDISTVGAVIRQYTSPLKASRLAAELDQPHEGALHSAAFGRNVGPVHFGRGRIQRQVVEEHFAEMAKELKLGTPFQPSPAPAPVSIPAPFPWLLAAAVTLCALLGLVALAALWALRARRR